MKNCEQELTNGLTIELKGDSDVQNLSRQAFQPALELVLLRILMVFCIVDSLSKISGALRRSDQDFEPTLCGTGG